MYNKVGFSFRETRSTCNLLGMRVPERLMSRTRTYSSNGLSCYMYTLHARTFQRISMFREKGVSSITCVTSALIEAALVCFSQVSQCLSCAQFHAIYHPPTSFSATHVETNKRMKKNTFQTSNETLNRIAFDINLHESNTPKQSPPF